MTLGGGAHSLCLGLFEKYDMTPPYASIIHPPSTPSVLLFPPQLHSLKRPSNLFSHHLHSHQPPLKVSTPTASSPPPTLRPIPPQAPTTQFSSQTCPPPSSAPAPDQGAERVSSAPALAVPSNGTTGDASGSNPRQLGNGCAHYVDLKKRTRGRGCESPE